jgi:hypothetical protein
MQENRKMRFQEAFNGWSQGRLTPAEEALLVGRAKFPRYSGTPNGVTQNRFFTITMLPNQSLTHAVYARASCQ